MKEIIKPHCEVWVFSHAQGEDIYQERVDLIASMRLDSILKPFSLLCGVDTSFWLIVPTFPASPALTECKMQSGALQPK